MPLDIHTQIIPPTIITIHQSSFTTQIQNYRQSYTTHIEPFTIITIHQPSFTTQIQNHLSLFKTQIEQLPISTIVSTAGISRDFDRFLVVFFFCCRVNQSLPLLSNLHQDVSDFLSIFLL